MTGEYAAYIILFLIIFFRIWNHIIEPFVLPWEYIIVISMLLFQKQVMFLLKVGLFLPTSIILTFVTCCRHMGRTQRRRNVSSDASQYSSQLASGESSMNRGGQKIASDWRNNLGLDTFVRAPIEASDEDNRQELGFTDSYTN